MLNKFMIMDSTYETGNHPDLVSALPSDLLSDYMSHSGPKLCFLFIWIFCHAENPIEFERAVAGQ